MSPLLWFTLYPYIIIMFIPWSCGTWVGPYIIVFSWISDINEVETGRASICIHSIRESIIPFDLCNSKSLSISGFLAVEGAGIDCKCFC